MCPFFLTGVLRDPLIMATPDDCVADSEMLDPDADHMDVDPPSFSASRDSMRTIVMVEHETDDMEVDEVRLEDEMGVPYSTADDSPHFGNDASLSSFMPSLIGRYIDNDEDQQVVPYDWGTPGPDDGDLFDKAPWTSRVYDYGNKLDGAYAQASSNFPLGGNLVHSTEGVPCQAGTVIDEPVPVVDRKGKGKQRMVDEPDELSSLADYFRDLRISGNIDVDPISECPSTATRLLSALLNRDGSSTSDAAPVHANVFSSNSFQRKYLSAFDKEPFCYRILHKSAPDISDPSWVESRLNEVKLPIMQTTIEPGPNFTPRTPVKSLDETNEAYTPATEEALSPIIGCDLSNQDPFAILGDTPSTPTHVPELRFKGLCIADAPLEPSCKRSKHSSCSPSSPTRSHTPGSEPKSELEGKRLVKPLSNQDPFAILGDTPSTSELRLKHLKHLCFADTPYSRKRSNHCSPVSPIWARTSSKPKSELKCKRLVNPLEPKREPARTPLPQPYVKPKLRICTSPRPRADVPVIAPVFPVPADVPATGGKLLLWGPLPRIPRAATTTTVLTPPPTPPKKPKNSKALSKKSKKSKSVVGEVTKPISLPPPPPPPALVEKVPTKESNQRDECKVFPGAFPLDEDVDPDISSPTHERSILQWVVEIVWGW